MSNPTDRGDFGIVFYGTTTPTPPTYTDIDGQTQRAIVLGASMQRMPPGVASAYFHAGGASRFVLQVDVKGSGALQVDLGLVGHLDADPTAPMGELATFCNDDQSIKSVHSFAAPGRYLLHARSLGAIVEGAIQAMIAGAGGDSAVIVRLRADR